MHIPSTEMLADAQPFLSHFWILWVWSLLFFLQRELSLRSRGVVYSPLGAVVRRNTFNISEKAGSLTRLKGSPDSSSH
jgi:hypothetical protein